jgi:ABC-type Fe3+ transport system substrate-binding protein
MGFFQFHGLVMILFLVSLLAAPLRLSAGDSYDAILAGAKKEAKVVVSGPNYDPDDVAVLEREFKKKFGFAAQVVSDPGHVRELPGRVAGGAKYDVINGSGITASQVDKLVGLQKVDWSVFPDEVFPDIMENYANRSRPGIPCLLYYRFTWAFVYNTEMLSEKDLPGNLEDLTDPKWKGRFIVSNLAVPLGMMSLQWNHEEGKKRMVDLARRLKANNPIVASGGSPGATAKVVAGEAPIATAAFTAVIGYMNKGAPIALWPFTKPEVGAKMAVQPGLNQNICAVKTAPYPNMSKLFTAWLSTQLPEEVAVNRGHLRPFREGDKSVVTKFYRKHGITKKQFLTHVNEEQEKQRKDVYTAAAKIYAGLAK